MLKELSDKGVVHRDISPGNVLLAGKAELAGTVGILHDVELADVPPNFEADEQIPVSETIPVPRRKHGYPGSRRTTLDTAKKHSRFTSSTLHGAEMTVSDVCALGVYTCFLMALSGHPPLHGS